MEFPTLRLATLLAAASIALPLWSPPASAGETKRPRWTANDKMKTGASGRIYTWRRGGC